MKTPFEEFTIKLNKNSSKLTLCTVAMMGVMQIRLPGQFFFNC